MAVSPASNALVTWAEYKVLFSITDDIDQDKYQTLINQASSRIEAYCKRDALKAVEYAGATALIIDGSGSNTLVVPRFPVNTIAHLYVDSERAFAASSEIVSTDYTFYINPGIILLHSAIFPELPACVKLECNAGYASTSSKWQILQNAAFELVRWMVVRVGTMGFIGMRSQTNADGMNTSWETEMPMNIKMMLEDFRSRE